MSMIAALVLLVPTAPPALAAHDHFGESAREVAREIHCRRFHRANLSLDMDAGVCWVKGKRVYVITFRNRRQQRKWNEVAHRARSSPHGTGTGRPPGSAPGGCRES